MEQNLSWKKAYLASALLHVVIAVIFAIGLAEIAAEKEQQTYVVDLATSNFSQGSGHEGGGGGAAAFPEPLKEEEVAKRVETVQQAQTQPQPVVPEPTAVKTPDAVLVPDSAPSTSSSSSSSSAPAATVGGSGEGMGSGTGTGSGTGSGSGSGSGAGSGTGDGQGYGEGSGAGQGSGDGNVSGTGTSPFDAAGFRAAIDANKQYPYMAIKRRLEGSASVVCTIDTSGSIVSVSLGSSSGSDILDDAALEAARAVGSFPNPTGQTVTVSTPVNFYLN